MRQILLGVLGWASRVSDSPQTLSIIFACCHGLHCALLLTLINNESFVWVLYRSEWPSLIFLTWSKTTKCHTSALVRHFQTKDSAYFFSCNWIYFEMNHKSFLCWHKKHHLVIFEVQNRILTVPKTSHLFNSAKYMKVKISPILHIQAHIGIYTYLVITWYFWGTYMLPQNHSSSKKLSWYWKTNTKKISLLLFQSKKWGKKSTQ